MKWLPKRKFSLAQKKLSDAKPSNITLEELSYNHEDVDDDENHYFDLYKFIINGNELHHTTARAVMKNDDLTTDEQVCFDYFLFMTTVL